MTPVDRLIDAVFAWEASKLRNLMNLAYKREADAALRATFEEVLADLQLADTETVEAVRTLRRQRDEAVRREAETEAVSTRLRGLAKSAVEMRHHHDNEDGHELPFATCPHWRCVLVRAPHGGEK